MGNTGPESTVPPAVSGVSGGRLRRAGGDAGQGRVVRTCAGCGRKAAKHELVRFVAPNGVLARSQKGAGRGVYTCTRLSCFERAASRRAFSRTLRRSVRVDPELARFYTERDANG